LSLYADPHIILEKVLQKKCNRDDFKVVIDGPDCSGKTTLANMLQNIAKSKKINSTIIHLDETFETKIARPRRNPDAVSEFLLDFFSYDTLIEKILNTNGLVFIEGMFLLQPWLLNHYDLIIRLELDERSVFERATVRDLDQFTNWGDFALHYISQALAAQRLYRLICQPNMVADILIDLNMSE
jgi:uridine kinase